MRQNFASKGLEEPVRNSLFKRKIYFQYFNADFKFIKIFQSFEHKIFENTCCLFEKKKEYLFENL